jgi:hypothetical protein
MVFHKPLSSDGRFDLHNIIIRFFFPALKSFRSRKVISVDI